MNGQSRQNIPVFILAGGFGTRISEETALKPKPMIEIGDIPILVHLMHWYYSFGFNDFVICAGYRSWDIKQYFLNYEFRMNHLVIDHRQSLKNPPQSLGTSLSQEKWRVRVIDTGTDCMTGARVARALQLVRREQNVENFAVTYGDGLSDVDLGHECDFHLQHKKLGTVLAVRPSARFGELDIQSNHQVTGFLEKPESKQGYINGGFFFFRSEFAEYLSEDPGCVLERTPLESLSADGQLMSFAHHNFWHPMDTLRDKQYLQNLWSTGKAPWLVKNPSNA